jgi:2-hydroxychromene-2-carboxylate isomerase
VRLGETELKAQRTSFFGSIHGTLHHVLVGNRIWLARFAGEEVWQSFLLGPIFKEQGCNDSPLNVYPFKGRHMWRDLERLCDRYGIPFARPSRFPRSGLLATRVVCLASAASEPWLPGFCRAVFRANFAEDREIGNPEEIRAILDSLDVPGRELVERAGTPENKRLLREQTSRAG